MTRVARQIGWTTSLVVAWTLLMHAPMHAADRPDRLVADFEGDGYGPWQREGEAFGDRPAAGTLPDQQPVAGFEGRGLVNTYVNGDRTTGTLTSPKFNVDRRYINFLIGGGHHAERTCMNLVVNGKVVRTAAGRGNERLEWRTWDVGEFDGKTAAFQIVDNHTGQWGHVNVDQIVMSDAAKVPNAGPDGGPDPIARAMASIEQAVPDAQADPMRPTYHLTSPARWINDPNGPVYYNGYYHVFYQHNPYGDQWGHMHWGHARSRDLVTWEHLPVALAPMHERGEEHVFSGCAALRPGMPPIVFYTSIHFGKDARYDAEQWAAVPLDDDLIKWKRVDQNPILTLKAHGDMKVWDWRDPYVFRADSKTYLVVGGNLNDRGGGKAAVFLYESKNRELTDWAYRGVLFTHPDPKVENIECPNFFPLGDKWVLISSPHGRVQVHVGDLDAASMTFKAKSSQHLDPIEHFYAPNTMKAPDGRTLLWGWVKGFPNPKGWNGCMTLPRVLTLGDDGSLRQTPAVELEALRGYHESAEAIDLDAQVRAVNAIESDAMELRLSAKLDGAEAFVVHLRRSPDGARSVPIRWDGRVLNVAGAQAPLPASNTGSVELRIFLDRSVVEVFSADGRVALTRVITAQPDDRGLAVEAVGGRATLQSLDAWRIKSIWNK